MAEGQYSAPRVKTSSPPPGLPRAAAQWDCPHCQAPNPEWRGTGSKKDGWGNNIRLRHCLRCYKVRRIPEWRRAS